MDIRRGCRLGTLLLGMLAAVPAWGETPCRWCLPALDTLMPQLDGSSLSLEYALMDQNRNWSGASRAPAADNTDKLIRDQFISAGAVASFGEDWRLELVLPFMDREFRTYESGALETFRHSGLSDMQLTALYSGLLPDQSLEFAIGFKLPTGETDYPGFPGDMQLGTGTTDVAFALSYGSEIGAGWTWSGALAFTTPIAGPRAYKPGKDFEAALALSYGGIVSGEVQWTPSLQAGFSWRTKEAGPAADKPNSGLHGFTLSPGLQVSFRGWSLTGEAAFPVYQYVTGNQLVAPQVFKLVLSYALNGKS